MWRGVNGDDGVIVVFVVCDDVVDDDDDWFIAFDAPNLLHETELEIGFDLHLVLLLKLWLSLFVAASVSARMHPFCNVSL